MISCCFLTGPSVAVDSGTLQITKFKSLLDLSLSYEKELYGINTSLVLKIICINCDSSATRPGIDPFIAFAILN